MNKVFLTGLLVALSFQAYSQDPFIKVNFPFVFANGRIGDSYLDIDMNANEAWQVYPKTGVGSYGCYYNVNGQKIEGMIKYKGSETKLRVEKSSEYLNGKVLTAGKSCKGFVTVKDSFAVLENVVFNKVTVSKELSKPQFAKYIGKINNYEFFIHLRTTKDAQWVTFILKDVKSGKLITLPNDEEELKQKLSVFTAIAPELNSMIEKKALTVQDTEAIYTYLRYKQAFNNNESILINGGLNEVKDAIEASCYFKVKSINPKQTILEYWSLQGNKIMEASYSSLLPKIKHGPCIYYYPNGNKRKELVFKKGQVRCVETIYYPTGEHKMTIVNYPKTLHNRMDALDIINNPNGVENMINELKVTPRSYWAKGTEVFYYKFTDKDGNNLFDENGDTIMEEKASSGSIVFTRIFSNYRLGKAYYTLNGQEIYQYSESPLKLKSFSQKETEFSNGFGYPYYWRTKGVEGCCLVRLIVNDLGRVEKINLDRLIDENGEKRMIKCLNKVSVHDKTINS